MHRAVLSQLVATAQEKHFWVKPIGIPDAPVGDHLEAAGEHIRVDFAENPSAIHVGDILFVYVIGVSRLLYVARTTAAPREATPADIARETWRERWHWGIEGRNLTPTFGAAWKQHELAPFKLMKEYNDLHPEDKQNLGTIQFGNDKSKISSGFAVFILEHIIRL